MYLPRSFLRSQVDTGQSLRKTGSDTTIEPVRRNTRDTSFMHDRMRSSSMWCQTPLNITRSNKSLSNGNVRASPCRSPARMHLLSELYIFRININSDVGIFFHIDDLSGARSGRTPDVENVLSNNVKVIWKGFLEARIIIAEPLLQLKNYRALKEAVCDSS